jgi:hypothetical protein
MLAALVLTLTVGAAEPPAKEPAPKLELFAKEDWYKEQKGKEEDFVGVLEKVKRDGVGFGRFNPYRLLMADGDKKSTREVYVGAKTDVLDAYVSKKIKLTGKAVDMEVEGTMHKEIWPARLELVAVKQDEGKKEKQEREQDEAELQRIIDGLSDISRQLRREQIIGSPRARDEQRLLGEVADKDEPKGPKILATTFWRPAGTNAMPHTAVIRTAEEAAVAMGVSADKAKLADAQKEATEQLAKRFKVEGIDWSKQMVVVATGGRKNTGGYSVEFTGLEVEAKALTVKWKLNAPKPGSPVTQAITHPAAAALVERFDGEVKFDPPPPKGDGKDK